MSSQRSPMGKALWAGFTDIVTTLQREKSCFLNEEGGNPVFSRISKKNYYTPLADREASAPVNARVPFKSLIY